MKLDALLANFQGFVEPIERQVALAHADQCPSSSSARLVLEVFLECRHCGPVIVSFQKRLGRSPEVVWILTRGEFNLGQIREQPAGLTHQSPAALTCS